MPKTYTAYDMALTATYHWRGAVLEYTDKDVPLRAVLDFIKGVCEDYDLGVEDVKKIFEHHENPYTYNIEEDDFEMCEDED